MAIKLLSNSVSTNTATSVFDATAVMITSDNAAVIITVANTAINTGDNQHGDYDGSQVTIRFAPNEMKVIRKRPKDTIQASGCYATKVDIGAM